MNLSRVYKFFVARKSFFLTSERTILAKKNGQHVWLSEYLVSKFGREQVLNFVLTTRLLDYFR